jgi:hypothetical protein
MRGTLFIALAVAALLLSGPSAHHAEAGTLAPASILGSGNAAAIQRVAAVCGNNGCVRVQTQRVRHQRPGSVAANHI